MRTEANVIHDFIAVVETGDVTKQGLMAFIASETGVALKGKDPFEVLDATSEAEFSAAIDHCEDLFQDFVSEMGDKDVAAAFTTLVAHFDELQEKYREAQTLDTGVSRSVPTSCAAKHTNMTRDSFVAAADNWNDFRSIVTEMEASEYVITHDEDVQLAGADIDPIQENIHIQAIDTNPLAAAAIAAKMHADEEAVLDSMVNDKDKSGTGLALEIGDKVIPIGITAIDSLRDRAGLTPTGLQRHMKLGPEVAAKELNGQFRNGGKGGVSIVGRCGKIRAMMGPRFAYAKYSSIMDAYEAFKAQSFPNGETENMVIDHSQIYWELNLQQYKNQIFSGFQELQQGDGYPVLIFSSSNTGASAFRIRPAIAYAGYHGLTIPLGDTTGREDGIYHISGGNFSTRCEQVMDRIIQSMAECRSMLDTASRNIEALHGITIQNPYNAVLRVMAKCAIPKKQGLEAADNFKGVVGTGPASAYDCLMTVIAAYSFFARDVHDQRKQLDVAMAVGRATGVDWSKHDLPGDFAW